jgi:hypothetical protein
VLKDEIEKNQLKKEHKKILELASVNPLNSWPKLLDENNLIKNKSKQTIKPNFQ